jgi:hypothetical protein
MERICFRPLFCQRFGCVTAEYEHRSFRELLYGHAKIIAPVLRLLRPDFFVQDFRFIRHLGEATDLRDANASAADFQDSTRRSFWRSRLKIRVSGFKGTELARELFADAQFSATRDS